MALSKPVRSLRARIASVIVVVGGLAALASCGSRTGLFGAGNGEQEVPVGSPTDASSLPDARPDGPVACTPGRFAFQLAIPQLMFVIDRSGSMAFSLDGIQPGPRGILPAGVASRWEVLRNSLSNAITPFDTAIAMGAKFYPDVEPPGPDEPNGCLTDVGVGLAPAPGNAPKILSVFDTTEPHGGTPTSEAIRLAAQYLAGSRGVARTMIVATDGAPNCNAALDQETCVCTIVRASGANVCPGEKTGGACLDDGRTVGVVKSIFETQKIPVYIIGIGGAEQPAFLRVLDDMAVAGGRAKPTSPKHYRVQMAAEMNEALASISGSVAKCTFLTPSAPTDPSAIAVEINGRSIARDTTHTNGWDWVDQAYGTLAFFGAACDAASATKLPISGVVRCD